MEIKIDTKYSVGENVYAMNKGDVIPLVVLYVKVNYSSMAVGIKHITYGVEKVLPISYSRSGEYIINPSFEMPEEELLSRDDLKEKISKINRLIGNE